MAPSTVSVSTLRSTVYFFLPVAGSYSSMRVMSDWSLASVTLGSGCVPFLTLGLMV